MPISRSWFFPTSPRSPNVLIEDMKRMARLDGKPWGAELQMEYAKLWAEDRGETTAIFRDPCFSARDRITRAPRLLGLVYKPDSGLAGNFHLTAAGNALLSAPDPMLVFQRQLAKVQFSSPLHQSDGFEIMRIKPLNTISYLIKEIGSLTKDEIAIFVLTTLNYLDIYNTIADINTFRENLKSAVSGRPRAELRERLLLERVRRAYREDLDSGDLAIREGAGAENRDPHLYIQTKKRNLLDYADATMRYMVSTGIFVSDIRTQALVFSQEGEKDALFLLEHNGLEPLDISSISYDDYILKYLGSDNVPTIRRDDPIQQSADLESLNRMISSLEPAVATDLSDTFLHGSSSDRLHVLRQAEVFLGKYMEKEEATSLLVDRIAAAADIQEHYETIAARNSVHVAKALAFEWNAWRAMVVINHARSVTGNFTRDIDGKPRSTAPGGMSDILVEFENFWLVVEVTRSTGARQWETEGEPIMRHLGSLQIKLAEEGDHRPVYGLFIADTINRAIIPYIKYNAICSSEMYGGCARFIPLRRDSFVNLMYKIVHNNDFTADMLHRFLERVTSKDFVSGMSDSEWFEHVSRTDECG